MEKVEYGIMRDGIWCGVLNERGKRTSESVEVPPGTNWWYETLPWSPTPRFIKANPRMPGPRRRARIIFARNLTNPAVCAKWAYPGEDTETDYTAPYRLVHANRHRTNVLWSVDENSKEPVWRQILRMSAQWPRLHDDSDELSVVYRRSVIEGAPEGGIMFQTYFCGTWYFCRTDLRAPIWEVPAELRRSRR